MPWWLLLLLLIAVWFVQSLAEAAAKAVAAKRRGAPRGSSGGVSIMPGLIVMPLLFLGIALAIDHVTNHWGTKIIGLLHAVFGVLLATYIGWAVYYLKRT